VQALTAGGAVNMQAWSNANAGLGINGSGLIVGPTSYATFANTVSMTAPSAMVPLTITGASGTTANLSEWKNSAGTLLARVASTGRMDIYCQSSTTTAFVVKGASGGSTLQRWQSGADVTVGALYDSGSMDLGHFTSTGDRYLNIRSNVSERAVVFRTGDATRWTFATNGEAETGSNAGSNFLIGRYSDAGAYLGSALGINRATGNVTVAGRLTAAPATADSNLMTLGQLKTVVAASTDFADFKAKVAAL
jgi:hypothetical protein